MTTRPKDALDYHEGPTPGKLAIVATKPMVTQRDLSLAYTPGVAAPCLEIADDPSAVFRYTSKANLVAVVSNGTAVLGLGNIGPRAAKPVMEGKAVLFKKFADIDVFDLELDTLDNDEIVRTVQILAPTFGGINLEDIRAPDCFYIEEALRESVDIPVFHDDQHGTAIITAAAFLNALRVAKKRIEDVRVVFSGAGAAAIACAKLLEYLGVAHEHVLMVDSRGVVYEGRAEGMNPYKAEFARATSKRTLAEALDGADAFVGVSVAGLVTGEMVASMAENPIVFALANPDPEILPEDAKAVRPDVIMATGRSDYPNQVNNVLGFPFIFRGALDVRARRINEEMKRAAVQALAELAREGVPEQVRRIYGNISLEFGREYLIPKPFDRRVLLRVAPAVARAAVESGVAGAPIDDWEAYRARLTRLIDPAWEVMKPVFEQARSNPKRLVFPEGEQARIIKAAEICVDEGLARPVLLGTRARIEAVAAEHSIDLDGIELVEPGRSDRLARFAEHYFELRGRKGVTYDMAVELVCHPLTFGILMVELGLADGLVAGLTQNYGDVVRPALQVCGRAEGSQRASAAYLVIRGRDLKVFADCAVNIDPDADELADIAEATIALARSFGLSPRVAMLSFSNFGATSHPACEKVRRATALVQARHPDLPIDGEVQVEPAFDPELMRQRYPFSRLQEEANVLIFPDLGSANISYKLLARFGGAEVVGPILLGLGKPISVLQYGVDTPAVVNLAAITVLHAQGVW